jgi:hypothetical protein
MRWGIVRTPPRQIPLGQHQPVISSVLDQPPTRLDDALLETGERPGLHSRRQHESPPQVPEVVRQHAELEPDLVVPARNEAFVMRCLRNATGDAGFLSDGRLLLCVRPDVEPWCERRPEISAPKPMTRTRLRNQAPES